MSDYQYICMQQVGNSPSGKTSIWKVLNKNTQAILGEIRWYASWRQYTFMPEKGTIFSVGCLDDIKKFIKGLR